MKREENMPQEPFNWKEEIISWIKIIITAAVIAFAEQFYYCKQQGSKRFYGKDHYDRRPGYRLQTFLLL